MDSAIYNADCLSVLGRLEDNSIDLLLTDPPYKIVSGGATKVPRKDEMGGMLSKRAHANNNSCNVKGGKIFQHNEIEFSEWLPEVYRVLKPNSHAYIMINGRNKTYYELASARIEEETKQMTLF